tara:strand:- start:532 stop:792 length:261 start_codon:yes stop_codon:yes gene_type:complete
MKLVTEDKVVLSSVGCVIDKSTGVTFPIHKDDTIDWDGGTHVYDIENEEWFEALSQKDLGIVTEVFNSLATEKELYDFDQGINGLL